MSCNKGDDGLRDEVSDFYGKTLQTGQDLGTNACALGKKRRPKHVREALKMVHEDVKARYFGCGIVAHELLEGRHILDLGCGAGQDCYVLSKLVGEDGHVTGVDMGEEQLDVARSYIQYHSEVFGYNHSNVTFVKGYVEDLQGAGLNEDTYDVAISNCVLCLCADKPAVLAGLHRVLKEGGELYFSDLYVDRELSEDIRKDKALWCEGIGGAWSWRTLSRLASEIGFSQPHLVAAVYLGLAPKIQQQVGDAKFASSTFRLFKLPEQRCQPGYVTYNGGIAECEDKYDFDHHTCFVKGQPMFVNADVMTILKSSRFKSAFTFDDTANDDNDPPQQTEDDINPFKLAAAAS